MLKFQIGRLTLKNFLLHWGVSLMVVILNMYFSNFKIDLFMILILSFIPGMFVSILLIASVKELLKAIKEKEYITLIAMILFIIFFTKYYFKLWGKMKINVRKLLLKNILPSILEITFLKLHTYLTTGKIVPIQSSAIQLFFIFLITIFIF